MRVGSDKFFEEGEKQIFAQCGAHADADMADTKAGELAQCSLTCIQCLECLARVLVQKFSFFRQPHAAGTAGEKKDV